MTLNTSHVMPFVANDKDFYYTTDNREYRSFFIKGMNIGPTLPDTSPVTPDIPYAVCLEWFYDIKAMHINTIRAFTLMNPDFYRALYDFNTENKEDPLFLLQGVLADENDMADFTHAFDRNGSMLNKLEASIASAIDAIHGSDSQSGDDGTYSHDVSAYTMGFVLGLEWDPGFVMRTNEQNKGIAYNGKYLYTADDAEAFEIFLCAAGDFAIDYETANYDSQRPVAFLNWAVTDTLSHEDEPFAQDDMVSVNTEKILAKSVYEAGLFAAMDVYPYYPEFMNYERRYLSKGIGETNTFRAYLSDLKKEYSVPLVIAEFGLSTARGRSHESVMGYHQGMLNEVQQGEYVLSMMRDIDKTKLAGGFIFCWQDEWFKKSWNIFNAEPEGARFLNVYCAEQRYGIAAYEPGLSDMACYPDGDLSEWVDVPCVFEEAGTAVFQKQDEAFLYLLLTGYRPENGGYAIAIATTDGLGNSQYGQGLTFSVPADFLVMIGGEDNARVRVSSGSDLFYYYNAYIWKNREPDSTLEMANSGIFNKMMMLTSNPMKLPYETTTRPYTAFETGALRHGNANPATRGYDSLADFFISGDAVEIRLPWSMLNIVDPASRLFVRDFYGADKLKLETLEQIYVGAAGIRETDRIVDMKPFALKGYSFAEYHKRLKQSYYILQNGLKKFK